MTTSPVVLPPGWDRYTYDALATEVHDGDTVRLRIDLGFGISTSIVVRVLGIQAPEVAGPGVSDAEKIAGYAARDRLRALLGGSSSAMKLVVETVKDQQEGRGRYLARIFAAGERTWVDVQEVLVAEGHACRHDGDGKVPKWIAPGVWRRADGVRIGATGEPLSS